MTITKTKSGVISNGDSLNAGAAINLSPEAFFFANDTTLYVADSGAPKNDSNASSGVDLGDGGLQKWSLVGGAASVLIDSEVRPNSPQAPTNFGIGTLVSWCATTLSRASA